MTKERVTPTTDGVNTAAIPANLVILHLVDSKRRDKSTGLCEYVSVDIMNIKPVAIIFPLLWYMRTMIPSDYARFWWERAVRKIRQSISSSFRVPFLMAVLISPVGCSDRGGAHSPPTYGGTPGSEIPTAASHVPTAASGPGSQTAPGQEVSTIGDGGVPHGDIDRIRTDLLAAASRLVETHATVPEAFATMALVQSRFGKTSEAETYWKKCLSLNQSFVDAYHALGDACLQRGDYLEAEEHYREALRLDPNRPDVHHRLAEALMGNGKMVESIALLEDRVKTGSQNAETYFWLGQASLQSKDFEKAAEYHQASIRLDPDNTYSYYGLATACTRLGKTEDSHKYLEEFRRLKDRDQQSELERMAKIDDEQTVVQSAAFLWSALAGVYAKLGDVASAEQDWRKARGLDPGNVLSREKLVALYTSQQRLPEAIAVMEEICRIRATDGRLLVTLGVLHARQGDFDAAERSFLRAIQASPQEAVGHAAISRLYFQSGRNPAGALEHARKAVELEPVAPHFVILAEAASKSGDLAEARAALRKAMDLDPNNAAYRKAYESIGEVKP